MWKLHCAPSWQASQGAMHTRRAGSGWRAGGGNAELLGGGRTVGLSVFCTGLVGGKDGEGRRWAHSCRSIAIG